MRRLLVIAAAILGLSAATPVVAQGVENFTIEGTNFDGTPYGGTVTITWISDSTCTIVWDSGPTPVEGICMRNGPAFAAAYNFEGVSGLIVYQIVNDAKQLEGIWTIVGQNGYGTEVLTRQ